MHSMLTTGKKASMECLEWLEYEAARCPAKMTIKHAYNFGEVQVAGHFVDGYVEFYPENFHPPMLPYK